MTAGRAVLEGKRLRPRDPGSLLYRKEHDGLVDETDPALVWGAGGHGGHVSPVTPSPAASAAGGQAAHRH